MKRKTIKAVLRKKFNEFLDSIDHEPTKELIANNSIITGGSIVSMLLNEKVNDFDVYFTDKETVKAVAKYYCKKFNKAHQGRSNAIDKDGRAWVLDGADVEQWKKGNLDLADFTNYDNPNAMKYSEDARMPVMLQNTAPDRIKVMINSDGVAGDSDEGFIPDEELVTTQSIFDEADHVVAEDLEKLDGSTDKYRPIFLTTNAISLSDKVQLVTRFYGDAEKLHESFDYIHATCYWVSKDSSLVLPARALEAIINKELYYSGSLYPLASIIRSRKFIKRGWQINAGQFLKMAMQVSALDLTDINVLEDQLVGVDTVYFVSIIRSLREMKDGSKAIDHQYIMSIIDKIF